MSRRANIIVIAALLSASAAGGVGITSLRSGSGGVRAAESVAPPTVSVETRDLVVDHLVVGRLTPAMSLDVGASATGTLVSVAELGEIVSAGSILAVVDDQPLVVLDGDVPSWREMSVGDEGADVEQLETALVGAGFDPEGHITVDVEYTSATASMVRDWQESLGAEPTGVVRQEAVVFLGSPMRVESAADVGAAVVIGDVVAGLASLDRVAVSEVPVGETLDLAVGDAITVQLLDRTMLPAAVQSITASTDPSVRVMTVEAPAVDGVIGLGGIDVEISWSETVASEVPTLPSGAFRRLDDGTYVVDVVAEGGLHALLVEPGRQVGSRVEVSGVPVDAQVVSP